MIDAHLHLWDLETGGPDEYGWLRPEHGALNRSYSPGEAGAELSAAAVDGAILVQADDTTADTEAMLAAAAANPWGLGVVGWVPLEHPDLAAAELDRLANNPQFKGVRHLIHDDPRDDFLELPPVRSSLALLAQRKLCFDVADAFPRHLDSAIRLARELPELTLVLDHLGKPPSSGAHAGAANGSGNSCGWERWRSGVQMLAVEPNTVAKVSGLFRPGTEPSATALRPLWEMALDWFGPARIMLGSDWPVSTLSASYGRTVQVLRELAGELSADEARQVLGGTAERVYRLNHKEMNE
uniref:amidohydrolase family protein n=1 Tax=Paenarthrobacter nicotinovorans TaxID=29320 RepID=UPI003F497063